MAETGDMAPERTTPAPRRAPRNGGSRRSAASTSSQPDDLEAQVAQLQDDIRQIGQTLARMGNDRVGEAKSAARSQADSLRKRGQSALGSAQDEFSAIERQLRDSIRDKPLTAVAGAVALGFLLAVITR